MKTTDIPSTTSNIFFFSNQLKMDDARIAAAQSGGGKPKQTNGRCVGVCRVFVELPDGEIDTRNPSLDYPIFVDDIMFKGEHPFDWDKNPLASVVKLVNDTLEIYINTFMYQLFFNIATRDIVIGIIAHEVGHILAKHFDLPKEEREAFPDWGKLTQHLLNGESVFSDREHEATQYAIGLVGIGPVIAMLALQASLSPNIALRMEFSNQIHRIIGQLNSSYTPPRTRYTQLSVTILSEEKLAEILASTDINETTV